MERHTTDKAYTTGIKFGVHSDVYTLFTCFIVSKYNLAGIVLKARHDKFIMINILVDCHGEDMCTLLPFLHSISGRDISSHLYGIGKATWLAKAKKMQLPSLHAFGEDMHDISDEMIDEALALLKAVYGYKNDKDLAHIRTQKFLGTSANSRLLKTLPPTEAAYKEHVRRAAYATLIDKTCHEGIPALPPMEDFGWKTDGEIPLPVLSTLVPWPEVMTKKLSCKCKKGCKRNCSCKSRKVVCYVACTCMGKDDKCSNTRIRSIVDALDE